MKLKAVSGIVLSLILAGTFILTFNIQPVEASGTIYIRTDGSIEPSTANITSADNVTYYFTGNINESIVVERDNIVVDGVGCTVQGTGTYLSKGISLSGRSNVTITNLKIQNFWLGIYLYESSNNTISRNDITNNTDGIWFEYSSNNTISGNNITGHLWGIYFLLSPNNILRENNIANNQGGFIVDNGNSDDSSLWFNDVDSSNIVDGKPFYYWIDKHNLTVPPNAGYVILVDCTYITVQNLNLTSKLVGLFFTTNSTITKNNINCISFYKSSNNKIHGNEITNNSFAGITLNDSTRNSIYGNNITDNVFGIFLWISHNNSIFENNIIGNDYAITLASFNNTIYHNNFIDNTKQTLGSLENTWDDGYPSGGNFWSDHNPPDIYSGPNQDIPGSDEIGDTPYIIIENNIDRYPLIYPYGYVPSPDLNGDENINILDVIVCALAFGGRPGDLKWNPIADLDSNGIINILDLVKIGVNFGKTY